MICAWLAHRFPAPYWPLAGYFILIAVISTLCVCQRGETACKDTGALG